STDLGHRSGLGSLPPLRPPVGRRSGRGSAGWPAAPAADGGWTRRPGSPLSAASAADFQYVSTGSLLRAVRTPADPGLGSRQPPGARRPFPARAYPAWTSVRHVCAAPDKPPVRGGLFTPIEMSPRPSPHEPSRAAILARQRV